jgi:hypothetical protein
MVRVWKSDGERIAEDCRRLLKGDAMLPKILPLS